MSNQKISAMSPATTPLAGSETVAMVQGGNNVKATASSIAALAASPSGANPTATANGSAINGSALTFMRSDAAPAIQTFGAAQPGIVPLSGGGTTNFLRADGSWAAPPTSSGANPTATAGPNANNGTAATFMRSDASPAIQLASASVPGLVQGDGATVTINGSGVISVTTPAPTAANPSGTAGPTAVNGTSTHFMRADGAPAVQLGSASVPGLVQGDGSTISINGSGVISVPAASGTQQGGVTVDNITIKINGSNKAVAGFGLHPGFVSGRYYGSVGTFHSANTAVVANQLYAMPFYCPYPVTFTKMSVYVTSATGNVELGVYNNTNGQPGSLLVDCGSHAISGTGSLEVTGQSIALNPGWYWLVCGFSGTPSVAWGTNQPFMYQMFGDTTGFGGDAPNYISGSWTYSAGNLPANFPTPSYGLAAGAPSLFLRL